MRGFRYAMRRRARAPLPQAQGPESAALVVAEALPEFDPGPRTVYERLVRVNIRHTFYNESGDECRDFSIRPTVYTAALLHQLGMLLKIEPDGFSVLYDARAPGSLIRFLQGRVTDFGAWTRMSFLLSLRNPYFVGFTDVPIGTNPSSENFYLSNREAHVWKDLTLLNPGTQVSGDQLLPVTSRQLVEHVDESVLRVKVRALSGEVVLCKPRCVTAEAARRVPPNQLVCCDPEVPGRPPPREPGTDALPPCDEGGGKQVCSDTLYFDLGTLPEDWYAVERVGVDGRPIRPNAHYLYTSLYPMPLCFVDLLFSRPDSRREGVYPVTLGTGEDGAGGRVHPVQYTLRFTRRSTWWNYYVLPQDPEDELFDLRVEQVTNEARSGRRTDAGKVRFLGPCQVRLPGGLRAWRFLSSRRLPLEQRATVQLRLLGRTRRMTHVEELVKLLPTASPQQVLPMYPEQAWRQAVASLVDPDAPGARCEELLRLLRNPEPDPRGRAGTGAVPPPECYSDIFVYV